MAHHERQKQDFYYKMFIIFIFRENIYSIDNSFFLNLKTMIEYQEK